MFEKNFELNGQTLSLVEAPDSDMPGGFFIHSRRFPVSAGFEMAGETTEPDLLRRARRAAE